MANLLCYVLLVFFKILHGTCFPLVRPIPLLLARAHNFDFQDMS